MTYQTVRIKSITIFTNLHINIKLLSSALTYVANLVQPLLNYTLTYERIGVCISYWGRTNIDKCFPTNLRSLVGGKNWNYEECFLGSFHLEQLDHHNPPSPINRACCYNINNTLYSYSYYKCYIRNSGLKNNYFLGFVTKQLSATTTSILSFSFLNANLH